jgi:hypothetical protein
MIKTPLAACPACARHLRVNEPTCPFCRAELPPSFREQTAPPPPAMRLSRAALYALRVGALSVTAAACGGAVATGGEQDSGALPADGSAQDDAQFVAPYGGFAPPDAEMSAVGVDSAYGGFFATLYGQMPPLPDAAPTDASSRRDATPPSDGGGPDVAVQSTPHYGGFMP